MSDSDDWENAMDDAIAEKPKEDEKKVVDEDDYNSDEERKKVAAAKKEAQAQVVAKKAVKEAPMTTAERNKLRREIDDKKKKIDTTGLSEGAKSLAHSMAEEQDLVDGLFDTQIEQESANLKTPKQYTEFGKKISNILYEGKAPYNIPAFFQEMFRNLSSTQIRAEDIKKIADAATVAHTQKFKDEKGKTNEKKKSKKPAIKQVHASYEMNNNPGMVTDLMGDEKEYGEEEEGATFKREEEASYDFM